MSKPERQPKVRPEVRAGEIVFKLSGVWTLETRPPDFADVFRRASGAGQVRLAAFDLAAVEEWDSALLVFLRQGENFCREKGLEFKAEGLPESLRKLLALARAGPVKEEVAGGEEDYSVLARVGRWGARFCRGCLETMYFLGECALSAAGWLRGKRRLRRRFFLLILQDTGAEALPIITLISLLVGLIIAFLGAVVLKKFAAEYYISWLIGYGMLREMGAIMTGVVLAGRTGAAFAAEIGAMKVSEEIDALKTLGISPYDFLVLPRLLALSLMLPLLTIYADVIGICSGALVTRALIGLSLNQFYSGLEFAVGWPDFALGVIKGAVFGALVALSGCHRGLQCGKSADAVGRAATSAVVTGIVLIVLATAVINWIAAIYNF